MKRHIWLARLLGVAVTGCLFVYAQAPKEEPVGLVLTASGAKVLRANTETPLGARSGDILFAGDSLNSEAGAANFLFCPQKTSQTLDPNGSVSLDSKTIKVKSGKLSGQKPVNACFLPQVVRVAVASQQHYGVSMTRGLARPEGEIIAFDALPADVRNELAAFEAALKTDPSDASAWLEEAAVYDRHKLEPNALFAYRKVADLWKDAAWVRGRIFELEESLANAAALKAAEITPDAKVYAMLVGISKYQKLPQDEWLQFPDADAKAFAKQLGSPRGGAVPQDQLLVLTNEQATTAAIRNGFATFLKQRPGPKDTVFVMLSGHGVADTRGSFVLTWDSDPQDLSTTAIPISEIQQLVDEELSKVGRVVLLADVSRTAALGNLKTAAVGSAVEKLGQAKGEMLGLMGSRPKEVSVEGQQYGGGHGAFAWSVLQGINGAADANNDKAVEAGEFIDYVRIEVPGLTGSKQHPRDFGSIENGTRLADLTKGPGPITRFKTIWDSRAGEPLLLAQATGAPAITTEAQNTINEFQSAVQAKRILPGQPDNALDILDRLRRQVPAEVALLQENSLRVALEDQAQQVLLKYLAGDQTPATRAEFEAGSLYMEAAMRLTPESLLLQARDAFFTGRALLFEKKYADAANLLEQAVRTDPSQAYGYNALGIAYLEQAQYAKAIPALRDASRLAPNWSYPRHNLALAYEESGNTQGAIQAYQEAMRLTPQFSYLPYNLGLVYQRINRRKDAEASYRKAAALAPDSGEPLNALGSLKAAEGKTAEAEQLYRQALQKNPTMLPARHNLALLLGGIKSRQPEAIEEFRKILTINPDFLPSRLSLAELLAQRGDTAEAAIEYKKVVDARPEYTGARVALAEAYIKSNQSEAALEQLKSAVKLEAEDPLVWERLGDVEKTLNHPDQAREAWTTALKLQEEKSLQKRLRIKMSF
jgi:Tfp pilus assembly protein PilF